jgi:hypothetical protein
VLPGKAEGEGVAVYEEIYPDYNGEVIGIKFKLI